MVLLDIKSSIQKAFDGYIGPLVIACLIIGAAVGVVNAFPKFKEDTKGALVELGTYLLFGFASAAVLTAMVEGFKALKLY